MQKSIGIIKEVNLLSNETIITATFLRFKFIKRFYSVTNHSDENHACEVLDGWVGTGSYQKQNIVTGMQ